MTGWCAACDKNAQAAVLGGGDAAEIQSMKRIFSRENLLALLLCLILIALVIFTADSGPTWIYQGF